MVERAQRGDRDAFSSLVAQSLGRIFGVAYRILRETDAAEDATQQAFLDAWCDLPSLRDPARWEAWTYRLVVRACYDQRRRERRHEMAVRLLSRPPAPIPDVATGVDDRDALERGFRRLDPGQRAVVVLHHHAGLPLTEIAGILGIPEGTARSRLHNAKRRLRAALIEDGIVSSQTKEGMS